MPKWQATGTVISDREFLCDARCRTDRRTMQDMDPNLVELTRRSLEADRARILLVLAEEVEHPKVAHGAQTAAATEVSESQRGQQLREREEKHLGLIEGALSRIEAGSYGVCQNCGQPIAVERLKALAWAQDCIACHAKGRR
jgi:RNA polymerase-binding protein DksA